MEGTEISLYRHDLLHTAPAHKGCMKLLPLGKKTRQKVVVGDTDGVIQLFSVKKRETVGVFKGLPLHRAITRVELGKGSGQQDKIFYSYDQTVAGINRKGKVFFQYSSNLTEAIRSLTVKDTSFYTAGEYVCNKIENNKDVQQYVSREKINDMLIARISFAGSADICPLLICQDRTMKVLKDGQVYYEASLDAVPTALAEVESVISSAGGIDLGIGRRELIYGTEKGSMGQLFLDSDAIRRGWNLSFDSSLGGINCLAAKYDFTGDGVPDIIIGKDNGDVEIFSSGMESGQPQKIYSSNIGESVSSVHLGYVTSEEDQDLAVHTFSGNLLCLAQKPASKRRGARADEELVSIEEDAQRADRIRQEITQLKQKLETQKEKVHSNHKSAVQSSNAIKMNVRHILNHEESTHIVRMEVTIPVCKIAMKSDLPLDFILDEKSDEPHRISTSKSASERYASLAVHIFDKPVKRVDIAFKACEGKSGQVHLFIIPVEDFHYCQCNIINIKPLCLHQAIGRDEAENYLVRPLNKLSIAGHFSMQEIHNWICYCLPDIPTRAPHTQQETLFFVSTLLDTFLMISYQDGEGHFSSDSISTLAVLRDTITQRASLQKQRLNISFHANEDTVPHFCQLIYPRLRNLSTVYRQSSLVDALQEISLQEGNLDCFTEDQKRIVQSTREASDSISKEEAVTRQKKAMDQLIEMVKTYYLDWHKFVGRGLKKTYASDIEDILSNIDASNLEELILYFTDTLA